MDMSPEMALLLALDKAYYTLDPDTGKRAAIERFGAYQSEFVVHYALPQVRIDTEDLRSLDRMGQVECLPTGTNGEAIRVTAEGHQTAKAMRAVQTDEEPQEGAAVSLDWTPVVPPILEAAHYAWTAREAPPSGVAITAVARALGRREDDRETYRAVALLHERGYLAAPSGARINDAPALVTVTPLGLEVVGGWPGTSAEAATAALLAALDREIEATDEPEQRGRLERLRDTVVEVGTGTLTQVLAHIIKGGL